MPGAYTKQELLEQYEKLPDVLKDALFSVETADKIFAIGKKSGLTVEKIGFLAEETGRVILGLNRPAQFVSALAARLEVDAQIARQIALDINHQIFFPLRQALKETHQIEVGEAELYKEEVIPRATAERPQPPKAPPAPKPERQGPAIIDLGGLKIPARPAGGAPPGFLSRQEVEKIVAEKKSAEPTPAKIPPIDLSQAPRPPAAPSQPPAQSTSLTQSIPRAQTPFSTPPPPLSPQPKIAPIDLRQQTKPPQADVLRPTPPLQSFSPDAQTPQPPAPPTNAIDLRQAPKPPGPEKPKPKPWSGFDPYKEPIG